MTVGVKSLDRALSVQAELNNKIINGCFEYWQRGASFAAIANNVYSADRFKFNKNGTMVCTASRSADVPAGAFGQYSLLTTVTTAQASLASGDYTDIRHIIEGNVLRTCKGKKLLLSFYVKSSKTGQFTISIQNGTSARSYVAPYTINQAATWEKKTVRLEHDGTGTWDYTTGSGLVIRFALGYGDTFHTSSVNQWINGDFVATSTNANLFDTVGATFQLTDIMLVEDSQNEARDPDFKLAGRDLFEELQLCQRYFEKSYNLDVAPGTNTYEGMVGIVAGGQGFGFTYAGGFQFKINKRTVPACIIYGVTGALNKISNPGLNDAAGSWIAEPTANSTWGVGALSALGLIAMPITGYNQYCHYMADAEL